MKNLFTLFVLILTLAIHHAQSQNFQWINELTATTTTLPATFQMVHSPEPGIIYAAGNYNGSFTLNGVFYPPMSDAGPRGVLITRMNADGDVEWVSRFNNSSALGSALIYALTTDEEGYVYIIYYAQGSTLIYNDSISIPNPQVGGNAVNRVMKISPGGDFVATYSPNMPGFGLTNNHKRFYVRNDKIYFAGGQRLLGYHMPTQSHIFNHILSDASPAFNVPNFGAIHFDGEKLMVGGHTYGGTISLGDTSITVTPTNEANVYGMFYAMLDTLGNVEILRSYGTEVEGFRRSSVTDIHKLPNGHYYLAVNFTHGFDLGDATLNPFGNTRPKAGLVKVNNAGHPMATFSAQAIGGSVNMRDPSVDALDDNTLILSTNYFGGSVGLGDYVFGSLDGSAANFYATFTPDLELIFAQQYRVGQSERSTDMKGDGHGRMYFTGKNFASTQTAGFGCLESEEQGGSYLAAMENEPIPFPELDFEINQNISNVYLSNNSTGADNYTWNFGNGTSANTFNAFVSYAQPGAYNICLSGTNSCGTVNLCKIVEVEGLSHVSPVSHGNIGMASVTIFGGGLTENVTVKLTGIGDEIEGEHLQMVAPGRLKASFNLNGAPIGLRNLQVITSNEDIFILENVFNIVQGAMPEFEIIFTGLLNGRFGTYHNDSYVVKNSGSSNGLGVMVFDENVLFGTQYFNAITLPSLPEESVLEAGQQLLADNQLPEDLLGYTYHDSTRFKQVNAFFYPSIPAGWSTHLSKYFIVDGPVAYVKEMKSMRPLLSPASITGDPVPGDGVCLGQWLRKALLDGLDINIPQGEWDECFSPVYNDFLEEILEMALQQPQPEPFPATLIIAGILKKMTDAGCLSQLPVNYTEAEINNIVRLSLKGFSLYDGEYFDNCVDLDTDKITNKNEDLSTIFKSQKNEFCDIALEDFGASSIVLLPYTSARAAVIMCLQGAIDPNAKYGPGISASKTAINYKQDLHYTVTFENEPDAGLPAQYVLISDTLDMENYMLESFEFSTIIVGPDIIIEPEQNGYSFFHIEDLQPDLNLKLLVTGNLDFETGIVEWEFFSLDPITLDITPDPLAGFLPPNVDGNEGTGSVSFRLDWKEDVQNGDMVMNEANIFFDTNDPIITNLWMNVFDDVPPVSSVNELPETTTENTFMVSWTGFDEHAGIMRYNVYSAMDDGEFSLWISTDEAEAEFEGETGHTYKFFVHAVDWAQNREEKPTQHQASITILPLYTITYSVEGENGSLSASIVGTPINSGDEAAEGSDVLFTATPDEGFQLLQWTLNGEVIEDHAGETFTLEDLQADVTVTVEFEEIPLTLYTVSFEVVSGNGSLSASINGEPIDSGDEVEEGINVLFIATPDQGYDILNWALNDEVMDGNTTTEFIYENLDADILITVEFELVTSSFIPKTENVKVFPNPFSNSITLQNTTDIKQVILMNITGQIMRVMDVNQEENLMLQTEGLQPGIYLLRLIANDGSVQTFKVSKI
jgi:hypothetical protein